MTAPAEAQDAYRRCLALDPDYAEALVNLGRLMQGEGRVHEAEDLYRRARTARPDPAVAAFNQTNPGFTVTLNDNSTGPLLQQIQAEGNNPKWGVLWVDGSTAFAAGAVT